MPQDWIYQIVGRNRKLVKRKTKRSRLMKRRLLLQGLETRQLLAGDMIMGAAAAEMGSMTAGMEMGNHDSEHSTGMLAHEHSAAMALVSVDQATHTVTTSGNWSDSEIWENNILPADGARIVIPHGVTLTVDSQLAPEFKTIRIDGVLNFATDVNTEVKVDTIVSSSKGRLEMGTEANPIAADVTARVVFADDGAIDTTWDPQQLSRGAVLHGQTEIHGAAKTHRLTLAAFPTAGATSIQLSAAPEGWQIGDEVVVTGTNGFKSDEVRTITSIDGSNVHFDKALQQDHIPPKSDLNVYVANKTRNAVFTSENTDVSRRGHIMVMHTLDANIQNVELDQLGRTDKSRELDDIFFNFTEDAVGNKTSAGVVFTTTPGEATNVRGRYALHFHRGGNSPNSQPAFVRGAVVDGSPGWGFVNHSSYVNMVDNVAYGVQGASFYTEAGDEIGSMVGNIAIRTGNPNFTLTENLTIDVDLRAAVQDFGVDGDGFWLSGHLVSMRDNVSAGAAGHGMIIWSDGLVEADRGRTTVKTSHIANGNLITGRQTIPTWWAPLAEISNNESYGASIGFRSRYVHSSGYLGEIGSDFHAEPDQAYIDTLQPTIDGLTVWDSRDGMLLNYNERMSVTNSRLIGVGAPHIENVGTTDTGVGLDMSNDATRGGGRIENVSIEGYNMGFLVPRSDGAQVNNLTLSNTTDLYIREVVDAPRTLDMNNVTFGSLDGTAVADEAANRLNVRMSAEIEGREFQPFNFLMNDRVTLNGQQLYFNQQAADAIPTAGEIAEAPGQVPASMLGLTNQQLRDRFGTSFGGATIPADAVADDFLLGGVVGSISDPPPAYPPLYHAAGETAGPLGLMIDPGTLTNFDGPATPSADDGGDEEGEQDDGDTGSDDDHDCGAAGESDDEGAEDEESNEDSESETGESETGDDSEADDEDDDESEEGEDESGSEDESGENDDEIGSNCSDSDNDDEAIR